MARRAKKSENGGRNTFQWLQAQLGELISNTAPGDRLTAEPELAQMYGVSRATLREAMRTFEGQGLIRRRQGLGTYVVGHPLVLESGLEVLQSIETLARKINLSVSMGDLEIKRVEASPEQIVELNLSDGASLLRVTRVILTDNRPVAYLVDTLPEHILSAEELEGGFTGSVLDFLLKRGNPQLTSSLADIQAVLASSTIAKALEIQRGDVLLMFSAKLFTATGEVVDYSQSYFLPGTFRFHVVRRVETDQLRTVNG